jgi:hypothetical protein
MVNVAVIGPGLVGSEFISQVNMHSIINHIISYLLSTGINSVHGNIYSCEDCVVPS